MSWRKIVDSAMKKPGKFAKVTGKKALKYGKEHPYKTAAIGGAGALGLAALSGGEEQSSEMTQLVEQLRQQGLSDEEIAVYLDNMMQAQGE